MNIGKKITFRLIRSLRSHLTRCHRNERCCFSLSVGWTSSDLQQLGKCLDEWPSALIIFYHLLVDMEMTNGLIIDQLPWYIPDKPSVCWRIRLHIWLFPISIAVARRVESRQRLNCVIPFFSRQAEQRNDRFKLKLWRKTSGRKGEWTTLGSPSIKERRAGRARMVIRSLRSRIVCLTNWKKRMTSFSPLSVSFLINNEKTADDDDRRGTMVRLDEYFSHAHAHPRDKDKPNWIKCLSWSDVM